MTKIEWTDETWNPIIGCTKVSQGCANCYAETMAKRLSGIKTTSYYKKVIVHHPLDPRYGKWNGVTHFEKSQLEKPLKRKKQTMYFVVSMGDLFHESVPFEWIENVFGIMSQTPQHTYQVLTKMLERMLEFYEWFGEKMASFGFNSIPSQSENAIDYLGILPNLWIGTTVENQEQANKRIPILLKIPAKIHFVSGEPMLSEINLHPWIEAKDIDWVICGGESGHNARPMHPDWVRSLRDQCESENVPFFFKQWGEYKQIGECGNEKDDSLYYEDPSCEILNLMGGWGAQSKSAIYVKKIGKKNTGCLLDGKEYKQLPNTK